jgi:hypothetical protein
VFLLSVVAIFATTGCLKLIASVGSARYLDLADPITRMPFRQLLLAVGVTEIAVAAVSAQSRFARTAAWPIAWLATGFSAYRFALWWIGWQKPCDCLGNLTEALHISPVVADNVMKGVLAYLLIGSCLVLWLDRKRNKANSANGAEATASGA